MTRGIFTGMGTRLSVLFLCLATFGCTLPSGNGASSPSNAAGILPEPTVAPRPAEKIDTVLQGELEKLAGSIDAKVGIGAVLLETGEAAYVERTTRFASQSVYKLPIAMAVMKMLDEGRVRVDQQITITPDDYVRRGFHSPIRNLNPGGTIMPLGEIVRYSISESDGTASDVLLDLAGGPSVVQQYLNGIGITEFIVADSEKSISKDWETQYRNYATPQASIDLLRALFDRRAGLSKRATDILLNAMTETDTGRRRLRRGLPEGSVLAHKTGTGGRASEVPGANRTAANANINSNANAPSTRANAANSKAALKLQKPTNTRSRSTAEKREITSATNDIGIVTLPDGRHILIAVYVMDSPEDTPTREKLIADIARAICMRWAASSYAAEPTNPGNNESQANTAQ